MKKIIPVLIVGVLVLSGLGAVAFPVTKLQTKEIQSLSSTGDTLDQVQPDMDWFAPIGVFPLVPGVNYMVAQSFKPTLKILTRVELMTGRNGTTTYDYTLAIRDDLYGADLTTISLPASSFVVENFSWVEFDFDDIEVTPGDTYYIVSYTTNATDNWYVWGAKLANVYPDGMPFVSLDDGATWEGEPDADMTFMTYGTDNTAPDAPLIDGQINGEVGQEYEYTFVATDPDGDDVYYWILWGDGCPAVEWIGPYASGEVVTVSHTFESEGDFTISAKAKDTYDAEGDWGYLEVTMPLNQQVPQNQTVRMKLLQRIFQQFPLVQKLLGI